MHNEDKIKASDNQTPGSRQEATSPKAAPGDLLSHDEEIALLRALSRGNGRVGAKGFSEAEAEEVWEWARELRFKSAILDLALSSLIDITIRADGELVFTPVTDRPDLVAQLRADAEIEPPAA
jgi:hypothetical protein